MAGALVISDLQEPGLLIDPDGEGVYLHADMVPGSLTTAALILHGTRAAWRDVESQLAYLRPGDDDHWYPASIGRWPRGWRLNLPRRWRPVLYIYYTPKP